MRIMPIWTLAVLLLPCSSSASGDGVFGKGQSSQSSPLHRLRVSIQAPLQHTPPFLRPSFANIRRGGGGVAGVGAANSTCLASSFPSKIPAPATTDADCASFTEVRSNATEESPAVSSAAATSDPDRVYVDLTSEDRPRDWPIRNELFEGRLRFLLRADPTNTYDFRGDRNVHWELQMQGRFKRTPGPLYLGIEIPEEEDQFRISWPMRAVSNAFCGLIKFMGYNLLHKSFGEKGDRPHFATPAFQAFDKFVTSEPNQPYPELGQFIEEPHDSAMRRRKFEADHIVDPTLLYTLSFNDTFFDPINWQVTGVPLLKPVDMSKFTNNIRFVVYEVEEEDNKPLGSRNGDAKAVAHGTHTKRNIVMWFQLHRQNSLNKPNVDRDNVQYALAGNGINARNN